MAQPDRTQDALALWIAQQQHDSQMAQHRHSKAELHLHQHNHAAPPSTATEKPQPAHYHPLVVATYAVLMALAVSVPLALLGAMVDSLNRPSVQYVQPSRGGW